MENVKLFPDFAAIPALRIQKTGGPLLAMVIFIW